METNQTSQGLFSGVLFLTDLDNTLLDARKRIHPRNIEAIRYFQQEGGLFTIATGRGYWAAREVAHTIHINCPAVTYNGAVIYDYQRDCPAWHGAEALLPERYRRLFRQVYEQFPDVGMQAYIGKRACAVTYSDVVTELIGLEHQLDVPITIDRLPARAHKVLFGGDPRVMKEIESFCHTQDMRGIRDLYTAAYFYEWLADGHNKASGMCSLAHRLGIPLSQVVAAGDYYNDVELLQEAGFPVAAGNAPDDIQQMSRIVTCNCEQGVIADAVEHLEGLIRRHGRIPDRDE